MFDSWDDYAKAIFNPAASTYDMIVETDEAIKKSKQQAEQNKRDKAEKDAATKKKLAEQAREEREEQRKAEEAEAKHRKELEEEYGEELAEEVLGSTTPAASAAKSTTTGAVSIPTGSSLTGTDNTKLIFGGVAAALLVGAIYMGGRKK
jgi:cobalamin biosynthesis Mg chelatase CobN